MNLFCEVGTLWQVGLLVFSLLTVIALIVGGGLAFHNRNGVRRQLILSALLLINAGLYVMMQTDSRITGGEHTLHLPYVLPLLITLLSAGGAVWAILSETQKRKTLDNTSIKEAFDNLPTGVCFFNEAGLPVLCNREMHRFSFAVCGKDVQFITDLQDLMTDGFVPIPGAVKEGKVFTSTDGKAWQLEMRTLVYERREVYTQFVALDVTDLQCTRAALTEETDQLRKAQEDLKRLSANVVAVTREEEILNTKMRVHDDMGRCLVEAGQYLRNGSSVPVDVICSWQRAVSMLKYNNETNDDDMFAQILKTCHSLKLKFVQTGVLPKEEMTAYILTCAVRECVTNAVRYADATELYVAFTETEGFAAVTVDNNGKKPEKEIVEGGGLSTLRRRVERAGGMMTVQSFPHFRLTVTVPKGKESVG